MASRVNCFVKDSATVSKQLVACSSNITVETAPSLYNLERKFTELRRLGLECGSNKDEEQEETQVYDYVTQNVDKENDHYLMNGESSVVHVCKTDKDKWRIDDKENLSNKFIISSEKATSVHQLTGPLNYHSSLFEDTTVLHFRLSAHRSWTLRLLTIEHEGIKLQSLMAWCNTLGGAHSALGESMIDHANMAGSISRKQLIISQLMDDPLLASKSKLFYAFSLLQQHKLLQAKRIIREEYSYLSRCNLSDRKLLNMCLSAWNRYKQLYNTLSAGKSKTLCDAYNGSSLQT